MADENIIDDPLDNDPETDGESADDDDLVDGSLPVEDHLDVEVIDEFEEDDFDEDFDDDFEEEIVGEYDLEDDQYGEEFDDQFGHLTDPSKIAPRKSAADKAAEKKPKKKKSS